MVATKWTIIFHVILSALNYFLYVFFLEELFFTTQNLINELNSRRQNFSFIIFWWNNFLSAQILLRLLLLLIHFEIILHLVIIFAHFWHKFFLFFVALSLNYNFLDFREYWNTFFFIHSFFFYSYFNFNKFNWDIWETWKISSLF